MKLAVNEGLWARNCATIQQVVVLKFAFGRKKFPGLSRKGPLLRNFNHICSLHITFPIPLKAVLLPMT